MIPNTSAGDLSKPRYFISQPVLGNECRILDRHNLEVDETLGGTFHRYVVVQSGLTYRDAYNKVKLLNDTVSS